MKNEIELFKAGKAFEYQIITILQIRAPRHKEITSNNKTDKWESQESKLDWSPIYMCLTTVLPMGTSLY